MAPKRKKSLPLETADQLRIISSPVAMEIIQVLRQHGPLPVSELGPKIGRRSNSLHYHIRKLLKAGMAVKTDTRLSGARTEAIYDVAADSFKGMELRKNEELLDLSIDGVRSIARLAARNFAKAARRPDDEFGKGKYRDIFAKRFSARLTNSQIAEVNGLVDRIEEIFAGNVGSGKGTMQEVTLVMAPLDEK